MNSLKISFKLFVLIACFSQYARAQAVLVITPSSNSSAQCPTSAGVAYFVTTEPGTGALPICTYRWNVTGGSFPDNTTAATGTSVFVKWFDTPGTGTLQVTATTCSSSAENGKTKTNTYTRLSVFGQSFTALSCTATRSIPLCSPGVANICVDQMVVQGTGGINQPPRKEVDRYIWTIPSGWRGNGNNGPFQLSTTVNSISFEPLATTTGGTTLNVVGSVSNTCSGTFVSNVQAITITRTPAVAISPSNFINRCGVSTTVIFSVPSIPCASTYSWNKPTGWSGTSNTNSISLTTNGSTEGTVSVTINLSTGGSVVASLAVPINTAVPSNPVISKSSPTEICSGESWTFTCTPPSGFPTNYGFNWYATGGLLINGVSTSSASPLATTSNIVTVSANSGSFGSANVFVRLRSGTCTPSNYVSLATQVGPYSNSQFNIIGPQSICANQAADFSSSYISGDITGYQWSAPSGWSNSGQGTPYFSVSVPSPFNGGAITLRLQNRCGWTNTPSVLGLYNSCGFSFSVSPNPVSSTLVLSDFSTTEEMAVTLIDKNNQNVKLAKGKGGKIEIDVSELPNGLYFLRVKFKDKTETQNIVISH